MAPLPTAESGATSPIRKLGSVLVWPRAAFPSRRRWSSLTDKTVLVTGASSGIGRATAELLAAQGTTVILLARPSDKLTNVVGSIVDGGGRASALPCDLAEPTQVDDAIATLAQAGLDGVVSNAGVSLHRSVHLGAERGDLDRSLGVNLSGPARLLLGIVPDMIEAGGGTVVNVSTVSAKPPPAPRWGSYQATKSAFDIWLRSAAIEWRIDNIAVRSVYMPLVTTPMTTAGGLYRSAPALSAHEAAGMVVGALVGGRNRVAPWWLVWQDLAATSLPSVFDRVFLAGQRRGRRRRTEGR